MPNSGMDKLVCNLTKLSEAERNELSKEIYYLAFGKNVIDVNDLNKIIPILQEENTYISYDQLEELARNINVIEPHGSPIDLWKLNSIIEVLEYEDNYFYKTFELDKNNILQQLNANITEKFKSKKNFLIIQVSDIDNFAIDTITDFIFPRFFSDIDFFEIVVNEKIETDKLKVTFLAKGIVYIDKLVSNLTKLSKSEQNQLIDEINIWLKLHGNIFPTDVVKFLGHKGDYFYKTVEINANNIEQELDEKITQKFINAKEVLVNIKASENITVSKIDIVTDFIKSIISDNTNLIFSDVVDKNIEDDKIKVILFATGINKN